MILRDETGLSLVEVLMAVLLTAAILAVAIPGFFVANDTIGTSTRADQLQRSAEKILGEIVDRLRAGRIGAAAASPPSLTILAPDAAVDLEVLGDDPGVPWAADGDEIRFDVDETVKESVLGEDLNGDGDQSDEFAFGIVVIENAAGDVRPIVNTGRVMLALPTYAGDVDGDGAGDPLFTIDDRTVELRIRVVGRDGDGRFLAADARTTVRLRNAQE